MSPPIRQYSFSAGELSPALYARTDLNRYENGLRACRNMLVMRQGGVTGRPGTQYVGTALNGGDPVRLIPFIFNETGDGQSYVLEFGNEYVAFYQNEGNIVLAAGTITAATKADPCLISAVNTLSDGDIITISGVKGMTQLNNQYFIVANRTGADFTLQDLEGNDIDSTGYDTYVSGGTVSEVLIVASPYLQADLASLNYAQSADVLTLVHPDYPIHELRRASSISWTLTDITTILSSTPSVPAPAITNFSGGGVGGQGMQYGVSAVNVNGNESELQYVATRPYAGANDASPTQVIHIEWDAIPEAISYRVYKSAYGVTYGDPTLAINTTLGFIGVSGINEFFDSGFTPDFNSIPPYQNQFNTTTGNYPSVVGFSQQRRYFGASENNPVGFWGSRPGQYYNYDVHTIAPQDDDAVSGTVLGAQVNSIQAIIELKFMLMLTAGSEIYLQGNGSGVVTPSSINASVQSQYGASSLRPISAGDIVLFNQSLGNAIRDFAFDFAIDGYRGNDITIFSTHLFEGYQIEDWCYQKIPDSIVWAVRSDGALLSCTYVREQQVIAWARHDLQDAQVENVCAVPENGNYAVYASVKRTIDGHTVRYIERLSSRIWTDPVNDPPVQNDPINASHLDCFLKYDGRNAHPSVTMRLIGGAILIQAGVNDKLDFQSPFQVGGTEYFATIPPGYYSLSDLLDEIVIQIIAVSSVPLVCAGNLSLPVSFYTSDDSTFSLHFGSPETIGQTLGFTTLGNYVGAGFANPAIGNETPPQSVLSESSTAYQQKLILVSNAIDTFTANMVGQQIFLEDEDWIYSQGKKGNQLRLTIQEFVSDQEVIVTPSEIVPEEFRNVAVTHWALAIQTITGLMHLEGEEVSVWADRFLVSSPLNSQVHQTFTVANGIIELDKPYSVIFVGLPMIQDVETLDLEAYAGETILARRKRVSKLAAYLYNTRSFFCGSENPDTNLNNTNDDPLFELYEERSGTRQVTYDQPPPLLTAQDYVIVPSRWNKNGRLFIRNVDPVPFSLLALSPGFEDPAPQNMNKRV